MIHYSSCLLGWTCSGDGLLAQVKQLGSSYLVFFTVNTVAAAIMAISARPRCNADVGCHEELLLWMQTEETAAGRGDDDVNDSSMASLTVEEGLEGAGAERQSGSEPAAGDEHGHEYAAYDDDDLEKRSEEFIARMLNRWKEERTRSRSRLMCTT